MKARSTSQILKAIGCKHLQLIRVVGHAYWYFMYGDGKTYETESVYTPRLSDMELKHWVEIGEDFVRKIENNS